MLSVYPAIFYKEKTGDYSVVFPDLNHLATDGRTFEEAMSMAVDCLAGYLYSERNQKHEIPAPTPITAVDIQAEAMPDDDYAEAFVNVVAVDVEEYAKSHFHKSVKKTLTIPYWLNEQASSAGINFSQTLQEALMKKLAIS